MVAWIEGSVIDMKDPLIVKTAYGIGYEVNPVSASLLGKGLGDEFSSFIYTHIKEDEISYYAFDSALGRELFMQLISVSGIGPKIAMALMRSRSMDEIINGIKLQDTDVFTGIKGLGKKTAAKMVLMLQDKLDLPVSALTSKPAGASLNQDAQLALEKLGYSSAQVRDVLGQIPKEEQETSQIIRLALKELMVSR